MPWANVSRGWSSSRRRPRSSVDPKCSRPPIRADSIPRRAQLGDYRILREVGRGGMGVVYEAEQVSLGRRVALKVLPFAAAIDPKQRQRFQIEAQAAAQLHHPHIVPIFGVGCDQGIHYYAMQFVDGRSLAAILHELRPATRPRSGGRPSATARSAQPRCAGLGGREPRRRPGTRVARDRAWPTRIGNATYRPRHVSTQGPGSRRPPSWRPRPIGPMHQDRAFCRNVARLGAEAADALDHAHGLGILHRDIKPANLLIDPDGALWITDFGLARFPSDLSLTHTGDMVGTLRYMSPEQALARRGVVDQRTDIYSLGVTLYELLTLRPAFDGRDHQELLRQIALDEPISPRRLNPAIPRDLETIVLKAMAKDPSSRYATAQELAADLRRFLDDQPILARRPGLLERTLRWARRHRELVATAAAILVLAADHQHRRDLGPGAQDRAPGPRDGACQPKTRRFHHRELSLAPRVGNGRDRRGQRQALPRPGRHGDSARSVADLRAVADDSSSKRSSCLRTTSSRGPSSPGPTRAWAILAGC